MKPMAEHEPSSRVRSGLVAASGLVLLIPALVRFLAVDYNEFLIFNADLLMIPAVFDDVGNGGSVRSWHLPAAPYFVPDVPLYLLARPFPNPFLDAAAFMVLQLALTWFVWRWLVGVFITPPDGRRSDRLVAFTGFAWLMLFVTAQARPVGYGLASYIHFGTFVLGLWAMGLTVRMVRDRSTNAAWLLAALSVVATVSDRWFVVWCMAPIGAGLVWWVWRHRERRRQAMTWGAIMAGAIVLAAFVHRFVLVHDNPASVSVGFRGLGLLGDQIRVVADEFALSRWGLVVPLVFLVLTVAVLLVGSWRPNNVAPDQAGLLVAVLVATPVAIFAAQLAMSTTPDIRYYLPAYALPLLFVGFATSGLARPARIAMLAVPIVFTIGPAVAAVPDMALDRDDHVDCIDAALADSGSRRGISTYWDAKPITVGSELDLTIATVAPDMSPDPVNASADHYGRPYDFAVMSVWADPYTLEPAGVTPAAGDPIAIVECGIYTVYDYGPGGLDWIEGIGPRGHRSLEE